MLNDLVIMQAISTHDPCHKDDKIDQELKQKFLLSCGTSL